MSKSPLVSVIMNCYNGEKYLTESLNSLLNQNYSNWELIFWDNLSTDNSKKIFKSFNEKRFKYFLADKHTVLYEARNLAIKKTSGDYIAFLDTDDIWSKDKLSSQIKLFSDEKIGLVYGNYWRYNPVSFFNKKKLAKKNNLPKGKITEFLLKEYFIGMLTVVIRKKLIEDKESVFNTKFDMLSDMDFILRFSKMHDFECVNNPIATYRIHKDQLQNKNFLIQAEQFNEWYEKIRSSKEFGEEKKINTIKNKAKFFKILSLIYKKKYFRSLMDIIFYPNNLEKIKLFIILFMPNFISNKIINLR